MDSIWRLIINHAIKSQWLARRPELFYACANGTSMCGSVCCIKQQTEQGRSFCKKNPFQLSIRKANVEAMRAVPALKTGVRAVAAHWQCPPCITIPRCLQDGRAAGGQLHPPVVGTRCCLERKTSDLTLVWGLGPRHAQSCCRPALIQPGIMAGTRRPAAERDSPDAHRRGRWVSTGGDLRLSEKSPVWWLLFHFLQI